MDDLGTMLEWKGRIRKRPALADLLEPAQVIALRLELLMASNVRDSLERSLDNYLQEID